MLVSGLSPLLAMSLGKCAESHALLSLSYDQKFFFCVASLEQRCFCVNQEGKMRYQRWIGGWARDDMFTV